MSTHTDRKADHLDLCATDAVRFRGKTTLLEQVQLVHEALPELRLDEVDLSTLFLGRSLRAPLLIAGMTGGVERAARINHALAAVAQEHGIAFGLGSMRPLLLDPAAPGYHVRDVAPDIPILGNLGVVQARQTSTEHLTAVLDDIGADALCIHLNPAMELVQPGGDEDFTGGLDTIDRLVQSLPIPVVVKETGCGLSRRTAERLAEVGIHWVDTGGAGGTSWVGVETLRASRTTRTLGETFWDWGIPTAASIVQVGDLELDVIATGGITDGLDAACAIALGAKTVGLARPFLQAFTDGGQEGASNLAAEIIQALRTACLLTGSRTPSGLRRAPLVLGPDLLRWLPRDASLGERLVDR